MNPFDLSGPQFLVFYFFLGLLLAGILWLSRHQGEKGTSLSAPELTDPYLVACLRAGPAEVWRLATVRLIDRGLLKADGATISVAPGTVSNDLENAVERAVIEWFRTPREAISIVKESSLQSVVRPYETRLMKLGLLPDEEARTRVKMRFAVAAGLIALVALVKVLIALDRGHKNVSILITMAVMALFTLYQAAMPKHTRKGRSVLQDLEKLFSRLHQPGLLKAGQSSAEVMWMAAVYGVSALAFSHIQEMYPKTQAGGSCGSSCGGGGCGGGCGGCGG